MSYLDQDPYEQGESLQEALGSAAPDDVQGSAPASKDNALYSLTREQYWSWLESLLQNGRELDAHLDALLDDVYSCQPPFYSWRGRRSLEHLLDELHEARTFVRAFEQDVEQISVAFSRTDVVDHEVADNAEMVLSQLKDTYNRAYDLCLYRLDRMSDGWIAATNLLISVTILVVTILFWMEFR